MSGEVSKKHKEEVAIMDFDFSKVYDSQFNVLDLQEINKRKQTEAEKILSCVAEAIKEKGILNSFKKTETEYVVDMTQELKDALESGLLKLDVAKDGNLYAQLRIDGKYGKKLPIKKEIKEMGIDPMQVSSALQMKAIEMQLDDIIETLDSIGADVTAINQGQQNDRIALFFSGMNMYLEARALTDSDMKRYFIAQSVKSISDANSQVLQQLQSDISYLITKQYEKKKGSSYEDMQNHMISINKSFDLVRESAMMKAAIYYDQGELSAMMTALDEYGRFIEKVIIPIAPRLTELDANNTSIQNGIWEKRAKSIAVVEKIKQNIETKNSYIIEIESTSKPNETFVLKAKEVVYA